MKFIRSAVIISMAVLSLTACHREKHYTCACTRNDSVALYETIGRTTSDLAYKQCQTHRDSTTNCIMEVRN